MRKKWFSFRSGVGIVNEFMSSMHKTSVAHSAPLRIIIIGGGYTGVAYVIHLIGHTSRALQIDIVEPAAVLGRGVAYGTDDPAHRINVPSERMSLFRDDPGHATRWLFDHGVLPDAASTDERGHHYVARKHYGAYVADTLQSTVDAAGDRVTLQHHRSQATAIEAGASTRHLVLLATGEALPADGVVLAFGHAAPVQPCHVDDGVLICPALIADPWAVGGFDQIAPSDKVLLIGTGLTMADVVASLVQRGHCGPITAISRRGLLPKAHGEFGTIDFLAGSAPPATARGLLRLARQRVAQYRQRDWHPVLDGLRAQLYLLWPALSATEQRRVVRRLLPFWEVHRFRIGPQVQATLSQAIAAGQLRVRQAGIDSIALGEGHLHCLLRPHGRTTELESFDRVIFCTGPEKDIARNPLIGDLLARGLVQLDRIGAGLAVDSRSRILGAHGRVVDGLFAHGPITRGTFGEMTGAPDIAQHLEQLMRQFDPLEGVDTGADADTDDHARRPADV